MCLHKSFRQVHISCLLVDLVTKQRKHQAFSPFRFNATTHTVRHDPGVTMNHYISCDIGSILGKKANSYFGNSESNAY